MPVIVGPTAVGKTALALALAKRLPIEIISADSRQVFRGLDIGTAKPTSDELAAVRHYGIDCVDPSEPYSAGRFREDVRRWLDCIDPKRLAVVVGGTGLYVRALAEHFFDEPPVDAGRRAALRQWLASRGNLRSWASRLDSGYQSGGRHRTARAIEVALLTGRPLSSWQKDARNAPVLTPWYIRLVSNRSVLLNRIEARVDGMLADGLVDETQKLLVEGLDPASKCLNAVGYREVLQHLAGEISFDQMRRDIIISTRQYAKRQETWFRNQLPEDVLRLSGEEHPDTNAGTIAKLWKDRMKK